MRTAPRYFFAQIPLPLDTTRRVHRPRPRPPSFSAVGKAPEKSQYQNDKMNFPVTLPPVPLRAGGLLHPSVPLDLENTLSNNFFAVLQGKSKAAGNMNRVEMFCISFCSC